MTPLEKCMVLHGFMCRQFGHNNLRAMLERFQGASAESATNGDSPYVHLFLPYLQKGGVTKTELARYDANILDHSKRLGMTDENGKSWKPFQWLALLFTERYLDLYFSDADALVVALNRWLTENQQRRKYPDVPEYTRDDIRTLAFQSATGSGKTLLLHANILQYQHYLTKHKQQHKLNKIILVTPDEGMSHQHLRELAGSKIPAQLFSEQGNVDIFSHGGPAVDIIDIHKFAEKKGIKQVTTEAFEENNLVLVDEGHLGVGGNKWRSYRADLAKNGFTFEYSATFNQAVAGGGDRIPLRHAYGKSILFDYSYKFFYGDGYGKDYKISNLHGDDVEANNTYLLACLLGFYQQCKIYRDKGARWREFNIEKPLWVFLGRTVTGGNTAANGETRSDVVRIVQFLAWVLGAQREVTKKIKTLISGNTGLVDDSGADIFAGTFPYIQEMEPREIYDELCASVFHGAGQLHISYLTDEGELQLSTASAPFGVINVGDTSGLYGKLEAVTDRPFKLSKNAFSKPLFDRVDERTSPVNIVIGARKFAAGWNSWRVSTMGLMHVGTGEGPQIIQMFGRGVRLKGHGMSLKRHTALEGIDMDAGDSAQLKLLETLNIFGLKANYMKKFEQYLDREDMKVDWITFSLPVRKLANTSDLKVIRKKKEAGQFEYSDERVDLPKNPVDTEPITLDRYGVLRMVESEAGGAVESEKNQGTLRPHHLRLMNLQSVYHKVLAHKRRSRWYNMTISPATIRALLEDTETEWYTLYIPKEKLALTTDYGRVREWEDLATDLIIEYADRYWRKQRNIWEHKHIEAAPLEDEDPNYITEYKLRVDAEKSELIEKIEELAQRVADGDYDEAFTHEGVQMSLFHAPFQTYHPLLYISKDSRPIVSSTPVALNAGEAKFVNELKNIANIMESSDPLRGKEMYLMRNASSGKGISFFDDHAFYPDFILWVKNPDSNQQDMLFIDPKGISRYDHKTAEKVKLHENIKHTQNQIQQNNPELFLHSYIWTETRPKDIGTDAKMTPQECQEKGIYFADHPALGLLQLLKHALTP